MSQQNKSSVVIERLVREWCKYIASIALALPPDCILYIRHTANYFCYVNWAQPQHQAALMKYQRDLRPRERPRTKSVRPLKVIAAQWGGCADRFFPTIIRALLMRGLIYWHWRKSERDQFTHFLVAKSERCTSTHWNTMTSDTKDILLPLSELEIQLLLQFLENDFPSSIFVSNNWIRDTK